MYKLVSNVRRFDTAVVSLNKPRKELGLEDPVDGAIPQAESIPGRGKSRKVTVDTPSRSNKAIPMHTIPTHPRPIQGGVLIVERWCATESRRTGHA